VLLSAFTNRAVDNALEALRDQGFDEVLRVGSETGVRDDMQDVRLVQRGDPNAKAAELRDAPVVAATTAACGSRVLRECEFDVAPSTRPHSSRSRAPTPRSTVRTGSSSSATTNSSPVVRAENDLQTSLFQRLIEEYPDASVMLDRQYRMSQRIQAFASAEFYDGALRPATPKSRARPSATSASTPPTSPTGSRAASTSTTRTGPATGTGTFGRPSASPDRRRLRRRRRRSGRHRRHRPVRAQVAEIGRRTAVTVDTVDRFQGSSKEVIVVSLVATGDLDGPIFEDHRRMNVALTRAKKQLTLVGDDDALASEPFYARMLEWAQR